MADISSAGGPDSTLSLAGDAEAMAASVERFIVGSAGIPGAIGGVDCLSRYVGGGPMAPAEFLPASSDGATVAVTEEAASYYGCPRIPVSQRTEALVGAAG